MRRAVAALALALAALAALPASALAQSIHGPATVTDGDSLSVGGTSVRLFGIDAPEGRQTCERSGANWACGEEAASQLRSLTAGHEVHCDGRGTDQYGRVVAICTADGFELNKTMVEAGWATAFRRYSDDYIGVEAQAKAAGLGIWSSNFDLPENWRLAQQPAATASSRSAPARAAQPAYSSGLVSTGCEIKGNRNRKGEWIYHLPGMPYYTVTRAEEMFCSEGEARAAGYRRAIVR
jgi:endonuclease YncB( thermonuclease family)